MFDSNVEQMESFLKDLSGLARSYYDNLIAKGFTEEQAFKMVVEWQQSICGDNK